MMGLREYARRRGCTLGSVQRAIRDGRLVDSVTRNARGQNKIADPDLADREWTANTRPRIDALANMLEAERERDRDRFDGMTREQIGACLIRSDAVLEVLIRDELEAADDIGAAANALADRVRAKLGKREHADLDVDAVESFEVLIDGLVDELGGEW